jgi:hypothetical protein
MPGYIGVAPLPETIYPDKKITVSNWKDNLSTKIAPFVPTAIQKSFIASMYDSLTTGTATGDTTDKLIDSTGNFINNGAEIGSIVKNVTDNTWATVLDVVSQTELTLDWDAFPDGNENYEIYEDISWPDNILECDGSTISDTDSPINGQILPDLNGTGPNGGRFLRGGGTAGIMQIDSTKMPNNAFGAAGNGNHRHSITKYSYNAGACKGPEYRYSCNRPNTSANGYHGHSINGGDPETRPVNMSVIYIMRIK